LKKGERGGGGVTDKNPLFSFKGNKNVLLHPEWL